jgi:hypothetical protein
MLVWSREEVQWMERLSTWCFRWMVLLLLEMQTKQQYT